MPRAAPAAVALAAFLIGGVAAHASGRASIPELQRALKQAEARGDARAAGTLLDQLVEATRRGGDWGAFLDYAQRAYESHPAPDDRVRALYQFRRCWGLLDLREVDGAEQACRAALSLAAKAGDAHLVAEATGHLGYVLYRGRRQEAEARRLYAEGLARAARIGALELRARFLNLLANLDRKPQPARARALYEEGLRDARRSGAPQSTLLKNLGITMYEMGEPQAAERVLLEARAAADREDFLHARWQSRMELGRLLATRDPARADAFFAEALEVLESQQANVFLEDFRGGAITSAVSIYDDPYDLYVQFLLARGDGARAFAVAERARARAYLDSLTGVRDALLATVPPEHTRAERDALDRITEQQAALRTRALDPAGREEALRALRAAEDELQTLRLRLAATHPAAAHARYPRLAGVAELQRSVLRPGEGLLAFFVGESGSARWLVTQEGVETRALPGRAQVEEAVRGLLDALHAPGSDARGPGRRAFTVLLGDVAVRLQSLRALVVVPGGALHALPFEALVGADGRFLAQDHDVTYAPSASSYAYLRTQPRARAGRGLLAVGDPVATGAAGHERGLSVEQLDLLKPLPQAGAELAEVAGAAWPSRVLDRTHATEPELAAAGIEQARIVHFATHGLVDAEHPERSGLALTPAPGSDGLLQMREIYRLRLSADLVTLSACRTAVGRDLAGEGVMGLDRAFLYAGAGAVMASLWNVDDASTTAFMGHFYAGLRRGQTIAEAARAAKLALMGDRRWSHPYYWAPFVATGNTAVAVAPRPARAAPWWPLAAAAGLAAAGALLVRRRGRRVR